MSFSLAYSMYPLASCTHLLTLHLREPEWLVVMLGGDGERVEKHQDDDQPIERHRFHRQAALPTAAPVPATPAPTATRAEVRASVSTLDKQRFSAMIECSIPGAEVEKASLKKLKSYHLPLFLTDLASRGVVLESLDGWNKYLEGLLLFSSWGFPLLQQCEMTTYMSERDVEEMPTNQADG